MGECLTCRSGGNFLKFILSWNTTCFGQFVCPSSGVYSLYTQKWYMSYRFVESFRAGAYVVFHDKINLWKFPPDRHVRQSPTRVCYTRWCIGTSSSSWWWAFVARNMQRHEMNILRKRASSWLLTRIAFELFGICYNTYGTSSNYYFPV
jgi:hypothetical protein